MSQILGRDPHTGNGLLVTIEQELITQVDHVDVTVEHWLTAGLIDLQVNGFRGLDLNHDSMTAETVSALTREMLRTGVTTFAPTLITASRDQLLTRMRNIAAACESDPIAAKCIPFIHVEGPHISPKDGYRGAHPADQVRPPSIAEFNAWQQASGNRIGLVTLSPHFEEGLPYIAALISSGVKVSLGHTHATTEQIRAAASAGATLSTHLGNAVAPLLQRHPNPIWSQLAEPRLQAMFIADGHHLAQEVFQVMLRVKPPEQSILVSDLVALAGMPPGLYAAPIGGNVELTTDGKLQIENTDMLAGAVMPLLNCIGRAVAMTELPLSTILNMANRNPGRLIGNHGQLAPGMRADILQFHWDPSTSTASVEKVWLAGSPAF
jgi:N-acetylglucosamine-6-phosphate deacetylase